MLWRGFVFCWIGTMTYILIASIFKFGGIDITKNINLPQFSKEFVYPFRDFEGTLILNPYRDFNSVLMN